MASEFDTESLISEVESRKHLWDASHEEYKNRELRTKAWNDIAANLLPDFGNVDEAEQKKFVEKIQKRWKTARDAYFKSRNKICQKSGSGATKVSKYTYHDLLSFLDRMRESQTESNFDVPQNTDSNDDLPQDDEPQTNDSNVRPAKNDFRQKRPTRNTAFENNLIKLLEDSKEKEDDDRAFLTSLMPSLKSFNQDQKLLFRSQVLQLVMSIKRGNQASIYMQHPTLFPYPHNYPYQPSSSDYGQQSANQNYPNQLMQRQQYSPIQSTGTPLPSPTLSAASTTSWEAM